MKITFEQTNDAEPEIIIRGDIASATVKNIIELLQEKRTMQKMFFFKNSREYLFDISEVIYFEADNTKTFAHIGKEIYEVRSKLYELENIGRTKGFVRISKGIIVNTNFIQSVESEFSGNYSAVLKNSKTHLTISRKYVRDFRKYIMEVY